MKMAEYAAHYALKDHRINEDREFFYIVPPRLQNALPGDDDPETLDGYLCTLVGIIEDYFEYSDLYFNLVDFNDVIVKRKDRFDRFPGGNIKGF